MRYLWMESRSREASFEISGDLSLMDTLGMGFLLLL